MPLWPSRFEILDKDSYRKIRRERGFGVNPWNDPLAVPSVDNRLLIDEHV